jgi:hypothetical protein
MWLILTSEAHAWSGHESVMRTWLQASIYLLLEPNGWQSKSLRLWNKGMRVDLAPGLRAIKILAPVHVTHVAPSGHVRTDVALAPGLSVLTYGQSVWGILHYLDMMLWYICLLLTTYYTYLSYLLLVRYIALSRQDALVYMLTTYYLLYLLAAGHVTNTCFPGPCAIKILARIRCADLAPGLYLLTSILDPIRSADLARGLYLLTSGVTSGHGWSYLFRFLKTVKLII